MEPDVRVERDGNGVYVRSGEDEEEDVLYLYDSEIALCIRLLLQELEWLAEGKPTFTITVKGKKVLKDAKRDHDR